MEWQVHLDTILDIKLDFSSHFHLESEKNKNPENHVNPVWIFLIGFFSELMPLWLLITKQGR